MTKDFGPMPVDLVERALWVFLKSANLGLPIDPDYRKFDRFTVTAYDNGNQRKGSEVERRLLEHGVKKELVGKLVRRFEIGIEVLSCQREMKQESTSTS